MVHNQSCRTPLALKRRLLAAQHQVLAAESRDDVGNDFGVGTELFRVVEDSFNDDIGGYGRTLLAWAQPFLLCEAIYNGQTGPRC